MDFVLILLLLLFALFGGGLGFTKTRVKLLKEWETDEETPQRFKLGQLLDVDEDTAKSLIAEGNAEKAVSVADDDDPDKADDPPVKTKSKEPDAPDSDKPVTMGDVAILIAKAVAEVNVKAQSANGRPHIAVVKERFEDDGAMGYKHFGDFLMDVVTAGVSGGAHTPKHLKEVDKAIRSVRGKALGSDELATIENTIGGFFTPPEFRAELLTKGIEPDIIRPNGAVVLPVNAPLIKINAEVDVDRQTDLYGGVDVLFTDERKQLTAKKGKFEQIELKPHALTGLVFVTDYLLRNAPAIGAIVGRQFADAFMRKEHISFFRGSGQGEPLGILNAPATRAVNRLTANEIKHEDVIEMRSRCFDYGRAVWVAGHGTYTQLANMRFVHVIQNVAEAENVGGSGQLTWNDNIAGDFPVTLLGRPIMISEYPSALGTKGDLQLISWPHYIIAESSEFVNDSSIHVRFDALETAFRFAKWIDGQPWWRSTLTTQNGYVVSPFVVLDVPV